jgi:hypothetical protein
MIVIIFAEKLHAKINKCLLFLKVFTKMTKHVRNL